MAGPLREMMVSPSSDGACAVLLASADADLRTRLRQELTAMRWRVREASGGAEAMELLELFMN